MEKRKLICTKFLVILRLELVLLMTLLLVSSNFRCVICTNGNVAWNIGENVSSDLWIPFWGDDWPRAPQIQMLGASEFSCVLYVTTFGMIGEQVDVEGSVFQTFSIPDCGFLYDLGKPLLPAVRGFIEVPMGKNVRLKTISVIESLTMSNCRVYPSQQLARLSDEKLDANEFLLDKTCYSLDVCYPNTLASISNLIQFRDHTLVQLSVYPVRFVPSAGKLDISSKIRVELEFFEYKEVQKNLLRRLSSPAFDKICESSIWNQVSEPKALTEQSEGYLIISHDDFYSAMDKFIDWKISKGQVVTSVKLSDIGANVTDVDIYNYVYDAYHTWALPPTYVLLVGDVNYVPTHFFWQPWSKENPPTDQYYACVDGDDFFPDIFVGRLSVQTIVDLNSILDKIIGYKGFFNKRASLVDAMSWIGGSNKIYVYSDWIHDFLTTEGFAAEKLYSYYKNSTALHISNAVNDGISIINYNGHGSPTAWGSSSSLEEWFDSLDILKLNNTGEYPIVLSFACSTGAYQTPSCLGEVWMKAEKKGAVAFFGCSATSEGPLINSMAQGFYKAIFHDNLCEFGPMTVKAKFYMANYFAGYFTANNDTHVSSHFASYNVLTDPQLVVTSPYSTPIYIKADGSVNPSTTLISSPNNVTYTFTDNINESVVIERNDIIIDGNGYTLQGSRSGTGFRLYSTRNVTIKNTSIKGFGKGVYSEMTTQVNIFGNNFTDNYISIFTLDSIRINISENIVMNSKCGIVDRRGWWSFATYTLETYNRISGNILVNNENAIELAGVSSFRVFENNIENNSIGISIWSTWNGTIHSNNIIGNHYGIKIDYIQLSPNYNTISNNNISANKECGIQTYCDLFTVISGNNMTHNKNGIILNCSSNSEIIGNILKANNQSAVTFVQTYGSLILHNSFLENSQHILINRGQNSWDDGVEGNYWSNYTGIDSNNDGIGDSPHILDANNKDNCPLMIPYIPGDYNHDGIVNMTDTEMVRHAWMSARREANYNPHVDFNMDGMIDIKDAAIIGFNWQRKWD